ncbi:MAG: hypothetical protein A2Y07_01280 [Planctomycetes bacterium GWF2_50_10]|nr:MAG: hypothetical protein A2Y07_01280 [Planctomycetes bacterium GWF2_50_10]
MSEPSLTITYFDLLSEIGRMLGYGRDSGQWSDEERSDIDSVINSGLRQFYVPPPVDPSQNSHLWSFLKPIDTITTEVGVRTYDLPDDFGGIEGDLTFETGSGKQFVRLANEGTVRNLAAYNNYVGTPSMAAIRPKASDGTSGQRFEIIFWKSPNDIYVLSYRKIVLLNKLSETNPYPLGTMAHGETILESCLSIAEQRLNDGNKGTHFEQFRVRLAASIMFDRQSTRANFLGYNGDRSDLNASDSGRTTIVTYNGNQP